MRGLRHWARPIMPPTLVVVLVFAAWAWATRPGGVPAYVLPSPSAVIHALISQWPELLGPAAWVTAIEVLGGLALGLVAAAVLVVVIDASALLRRALGPLILASQSIPVVVIGPLLTIALGYGAAPKIIVVALLCFVPVTVNALSGLQTVPPALLEELRLLGSSRLRWQVRMRWAAPQAMDGLRVAVMFAPVAAVFAEYSGSTDGLGFVLMQAIPRLRTDVVFTVVILLTVMSAVLHACVPRFALRPTGRRRRLPKTETRGETP